LEAEGSENMETSRGAADLKNGARYSGVKR
jgi:hypothetical protein